MGWQFEVSRIRVTGLLVMFLWTSAGYDVEARGQNIANSQQKGTAAHRPRKI